MTAAVADNFFDAHGKYWLVSLGLHSVIACMLVAILLLNFQGRSPVQPQVAIKATIVDNSAKRIKREKEQAEAARLERERLEAEQKEREEAEAQRLAEEKRAEELREQQVVADRKRKAEDDRKAAAKKTADDKKRATDLKKQQADKQKTEREAREQAEREAELKRQLADEEGLMQAQNAGLLGQYVALIQQHVIRAWSKPASARPGIQCEVKVTQTPGGVVLSVQIDKCNGDEAVRRSIENAVKKASPLPRPPDPRLYQRVILFVFNPKE